MTKDSHYSFHAQIESLPNHRFTHLSSTMQRLEPSLVLYSSTNVTNFSSTSFALHSQSVSATSLCEERERGTEGWGGFAGGKSSCSWCGQVLGPSLRVAHPLPDLAAVHPVLDRPGAERHRLPGGTRERGKALGGKKGKRSYRYQAFAFEVQRQPCWRKTVCAIPFAFPQNPQVARSTGAHTHVRFEAFCFLPAFLFLPLPFASKLLLLWGKRRSQCLTKECRVKQRKTTNILVNVLLQPVVFFFKFKALGTSMHSRARARERERKGKRWHRGKIARQIFRTWQKTARRLGHCFMFITD